MIRVQETFIKGATIRDALKRIGIEGAEGLIGDWGLLIRTFLGQESYHLLPAGVTLEGEEMAYLRRSNRMSYLSEEDNAAITQIMKTIDPRNYERFDIKWPDE